MKHIIVCLFFLLISCGDKKVDNTEKGSIPSRVQENTIPETQGKLEVSKSRINIGKVKKGKYILYKFILKNIGTESVDIVDHQSSCNCTEVDIPKRSVLPSDSISVEIKVDTKDKSLGKHSVYSILTTNGQKKFYNLEVNFTLID